MASRPCRNSARLRQRLSTVYASATRAGSRVFQASSAMRAFCAAVSMVNGGSGGRLMHKLLQTASSVGGPTTHDTSHQRNVDASVEDSVKACAINSSAPRTADRVAGPPRQTRTASGGVPSVAKASLATTPTPVDRVCPTKADLVQDSGSDIQI